MTEQLCIMPECGKKATKVCNNHWTPFYFCDTDAKYHEKIIGHKVEDYEQIGKII